MRARKILMLAEPIALLLAIIILWPGLRKLHEEAFGRNRKRR
jgi:hypothetical protein